MTFNRSFNEIFEQKSKKKKKQKDIFNSQFNKFDEPKKKKIQVDDQKSTCLSVEGRNEKKKITHNIHTLAHIIRSKESLVCLIECPNRSTRALADKARAEAKKVPVDIETIADIH